MYVPEIRPHFELDLCCEADAVLGKIERALQGGNLPCRGWVHAPYAELRVHDEEKHFWSPRLAVAVEKRETSVVLHCRFGPEPSVWTGFMGMYAVAALIALAGLFIALGQWTLGHVPTAMWATFGGAAGLLVLYLGALMGQRAGEGQMRMLRRQLDLIIFECTIY